MSLISRFANWWKTRSAQASADYYQLRFDSDEINEMRRGALTLLAREKIRLRLAGVKRVTAAILIGCLLPLALIVIGFFVLVGFSIYKSPARVGVNPVSVCFGAFVLFFVAALSATAIVGAIKLYLFRRRLAADLHNGRVAVEQGRVNIKVIRSRNGFRLEYRVNNVLFHVLGDVIGTEVYQHFSGNARIGSRETAEPYCFYYLPQSKLLLHFERA